MSSALRNRIQNRGVAVAILAGTLICSVAWSSHGRSAPNLPEGNSIPASIPLGFAELAAPSNSARNYYVSPSGKDTNDGSKARPWATIQRASNHVQPGATVHVAPGTYVGPVTTKVSGTASERIQFVSDVQWGALIRASSTDIVWTNLGDYVDIAGFDIAGGDPETCNGIINYASEVRIVGNNVHDLGHNDEACKFGSGIVNHQNRAGHDDDIVGNVVHDIGEFSHTRQFHHGIYHANLRGHIQNNLIYRCEGWGIHLWHAANEVVVANNTIFNNGYGGILIGDGDDPGGFPPGMVNDNTVVANNIVYRNGLQPKASGYGIEEYGATGHNNRYFSNLVYQNGPADWRLQNGIVPIAPIAADPQFVNYLPDGSGDYHLKADSPAIHAGTSLQTLVEDYGLNVGAALATSHPPILH